jgi:hypothetical protein
MDHAELGASNSGRWIACPGSPRLSRGRPNNESEYSRIGTAAHAVGNMALERGVGAEMWAGLEVEGIPVDDHMVEGVTVFVDYCRAIIEQVGPGNYWLEKKVSLNDLNPPVPMFGTSDFTAYDEKTYTLKVVDYKNGSGVVVEVVDNPQPLYYGLGAVLTLAKGRRVDKVEMTIIQPNAPHPDGVIRSWTIDAVELFEFATMLMDAARKTLDPDAPLNAGKHCRFCPASAICPAQREMVQSLAQVAFDAMPLDVPPPPEHLPTEVFTHILNQFPLLEDWMKAFYAERDRRFLAGELTGYKAVAKKANRKWVSEDQVQHWLTDDQGYSVEEIHTLKLKSPAQIEKLVGKKNLPAEYTKKESSGYSIVKDSDPRPALSLHAGDAFLALPSGE